MTGEQQGFYLIAVGRSLLAPHGVMALGDNKQKTYWPVRAGATTRYLSEPELADFYRRRFRGEEARDQEVDRVWREGMARLIGKPLWVYHSAEAVEIPGALPARGEFTVESFSVGLDELLSHEGAARVTYQFAIDIAGLFGIPDTGLVTEKGTLRADSGGLPEFFPWAEGVGLICWKKRVALGIRAVGEQRP